MRILLLSDIHGNFPALKSVGEYFTGEFDLVLNGGDTTVYGPFPNQTIDWLRSRGALSILGNTDRHIITLLGGGTFKKPGKAEKRVMYGSTAAELSRANRQWLLEQPSHRVIHCAELGAGPRGATLGMYHGSPADPDEFLFPHTEESRFRELAGMHDHAMITVGHSHSPFHKCIAGVHFINPGSVGRMFDGDPRASCATIEAVDGAVSVELHRIPYPVEAVVEELGRLRLPPIYREMYRRGRKLN
jgi:predicted phosphodiesterase